MNWIAAGFLSLGVSLLILGIICYVFFPPVPLKRKTSYIGKHATWPTSSVDLNQLGKSQSPTRLRFPARTGLKGMSTLLLSPLGLALLIIALMPNRRRKGNF